MRLISHHKIEKSSSKVVFWGPKNNLLTLFANGHMSFRCLLDQRFCWSQDDDEFKARPRFSSYAVVEYPVSFLRLYRQLVSKFGINDSEWCVGFCYHKPKGYFLAPGHPMSGFFDVGDAKMYEGSNDLVLAELTNKEWTPDILAYFLLTQLFARFGFSERSIPFYKDSDSVFEIG